MLHQLLHWPDAFDEALWPFALEHAVYLWNHPPKSMGAEERSIDSLQYPGFLAERNPWRVKPQDA